MHGKYFLTFLSGAKTSFAALTCAASIALPACGGRELAEPKPGSPESARPDGAERRSCSDDHIVHWERLEKKGALFDLYERLSTASDCANDARHVTLLVQTALALGDAPLAHRALLEREGPLPQSRRADLHAAVQKALAEDAAEPGADVAASQQKLIDARRSLRAKRCNEAKRQAELARSRSRTNPDALVVLGQAHQCLGDTVGARRAFSRAAYELSREEEPFLWRVRYAHNGYGSWFSPRGTHMCHPQTGGEGVDTFLFLAGPGDPEGRAFGEPFAVGTRRECCGSPDACPSWPGLRAEPGTIRIDEQYDNSVQAFTIQPEGHLEPAWQRVFKEQANVDHDAVPDGVVRVVLESSRRQIFLDARTGQTLRELPPLRKDPDVVDTRMVRQNYVEVRARGEPAISGTNVVTGRRPFRVPQRILAPFCNHDHRIALWIGVGEVLVQCGATLVELNLESGRVGRHVRLTLDGNISPWGSWIAPTGERIVAVRYGDRSVSPSALVDMTTGKHTALEHKGKSGGYEVSPDRRWLSGFDHRAGLGTFETLVNPETGRLIAEWMVVPEPRIDRRTLAELDADHCQIVFCHKTSEPRVFGLAEGGQSCGDIDVREICERRLNGSYISLFRSNGPLRNQELTIPELPGRLVTKQGICDLEKKNCRKLKEGGHGDPQYIPSMKAVAFVYSDYYAGFWSATKESWVGHLVEIHPFGWVWTTGGDPDRFTTMGRIGEHWGTGYTQPVVPGPLDWFWCTKGRRAYPPEVCAEALFRDDVVERIIERAQ